MQLASSDLEQWPSVIGHVSSLMDLDASARLHGALVRKRGVRHAADLLHLGLLYGPGGLSLRAVAGHATEAGIADLCDVAQGGGARRASRARLRVGSAACQGGGCFWRVCGSMCWRIGAAIRTARAA